MAKIEVGNKRNGARGHYIGRPSPLGNPFIVGQDGTREEVIQKFRRDLWERMKRGDVDVTQELDVLVHRHLTGEDLTLVCWCAPAPCHGDVIKAAIEYLARREVQ